MNENEIKNLWQISNEKTERSHFISNKKTEEITRMKAKNMLSSMKPVKIFTLIAGILWTIILGSVIVNLFIHAYDKVSLFFLYSATIQELLTVIAIAVYIYQLKLIYKIDFSEPVLKIQENLSKLKMSTLAVTRVLFLQLPVWTTFYLSGSIFVNGNMALLIIQGIVTLAFTFAAIWLFISIKYENRNKKWFKLIFRGKEWQPILQAMEQISLIEMYKTEESKNASH